MANFDEYVDLKWAVDWVNHYISVYIPTNHAVRQPGMGVNVSPSEEALRPKRHKWNVKSDGDKLQRVGPKLIDPSSSKVYEIPLSPTQLRHT